MAKPPQTLPGYGKLPKNSQTVRVPARVPKALDLDNPVRPGPVGKPATTMYEMYGPSPERLAERQRLLSNATAEVPIERVSRTGGQSVAARSPIPQRVRDIANVTRGPQTIDQLIERGTRPLRSAVGTGRPLVGPARALSSRARDNAAMAVAGRAAPVLGAALTGLDIGRALYDANDEAILDGMDATAEALFAPRKKPRGRAGQGR